MKTGLALLLGLVYFCSRSALSLQDIGELIRDLRRHSSSRYLTRRSLPAGYFDRAYAALEDPYVYIVVSDTGSPASRFIRIFTAARYNHVSLSFDGALETLVSYNGGNGVSKPGLNAEPLESLNRKAGASLAVYRLRLEQGQKARLIGRVRAIDREGSSYNLPGLLTGKSRLPNVMFCSQFVYSVLDDAGLAYFEKNKGVVRPGDFIREQGPLEFVGGFVFPAPGTRAVRSPGFAPLFWAHSRPAGPGTGLSAPIPHKKGASPYRRHPFCSGISANQKSAGFLVIYPLRGRKTAEAVLRLPARACGAKRPILSQHKQYVVR